MFILGSKEEKKYAQLENDFQQFLNQSRVHACLEQNKHVAYELLSSHADTDNLIFFAMLTKDYPRVIRHHIQQVTILYYYFSLFRLPLNCKEDKN